MSTTTQPTAKNPDVPEQDDEPFPMAAKLAICNVVTHLVYGLLLEGNLNPTAYNETEIKAKVKTEIGLDEENPAFDVAFKIGWLLAYEKYRTGYPRPSPPPPAPEYMAKKRPPIDTPEHVQMSFALIGDCTCPTCTHRKIMSASGGY